MFRCGGGLRLSAAVLQEASLASDGVDCSHLCRLLDGAAMASREDAQLEIDGAIEEALREVGNRVVAFMRQGRRVEQEAIAMVFLDEVFLVLTQDVEAVMQDLAWAPERFEEAVGQVSAALMNAEQEVWENIADEFALPIGETGEVAEADLGEWETIASFLRRLEDVFFGLRENIAEVIDGAASAPSSPSSSESSSDSALPPGSDGESRVILPLLKRRRGGGASR